MPRQPHIEFIARAFITRGPWVLLCRNTEKDYWYLPGGHVEFNESAAAACRRELLEETGLDCCIGKCLLVTECRFTQNGKPRHEVNVMFHVEHPGPASPDDPPAAPASREPGIGFDWVELASIPDLDLRPDVIRAWLVSGGALGDTDRAGWISSLENGPPRLDA